MRDIRLVFGADNLHPPLTGIGRYSFELAQRLEKHASVSSLRYFSMGRWIDDPLSQCAAASSGIAEAKISKFGRAQQWFAGQTWAIRVYNTFSPTLFAWRLRSLSSKDVFHAPSFFAPVCRAKKVATVHDLSHEVHPEFHPPARVQLMSSALPRSLAISDHVITVSETVRQELLSRYALPADRVTAIHLAADSVYRPHSPIELEPAMQALGLRAGQYCLFVGTVEPRKNVGRLVQSYRLLSAALREEYPLVIAGGAGWNSSDVHALIVQGVAEGWIHYLSYVDQLWLPALYAGARLMAYPSLYEGFGLPIVEAMASGTPVLTSDASCMPEVAGDAAALVDPQSVDALVVALEYCLTDNTWHSNAIRLGLQRASQLSWDRCTEQTVNVYRRALAD